MIMQQCIACCHLSFSITLCNHKQQLITVNFKQDKFFGNGIRLQKLSKKPTLPCSNFLVKLFLI